MISPLAAASLPPLVGTRLLSTTFNAIPVVMIVGALVLYLWGVRRADALWPRHPWSTFRTAAFIGGLVSTALSIFTFIGVYDDELFWDHMVQHLILIMVAAPLFAIASPIRLAWSATTGASHLAITEVLRSAPAKVLGHPITAFIAYAVFIPVSHLTVWYNYTLQHESIHNAEHLAFLLVGYLFWRQVFGDDPNCYRLHPALQFFYLFMAIPIDTFTGLSLAGATQEMFPAYCETARTLGCVGVSVAHPWGPTYVEDLHIGGDIMWVVGDTLMLWPMIPVALKWLHMDERKAVRIDRELDERAAQEAAAAGPVPDQPPRSISSTRTPSGSVQ